MLLMRLINYFSLGAALVLLAISVPVVKLMIREGGEAISFCNVLFIGNLCAGIGALFLFNPRKTIATLARLPRKQWLPLAANVLLAVAIPALLFTALQTTTVTSLILLGRVESIVFAVLTIAFFQGTVTRFQWLGNAVIVGGALTLVLIQGMGNLTTGDKLVIIAAILQGLAACMSKRFLDHCPVGVFVFVRNYGSAIVFFWIAVSLFGFDHFADAFAPELWVLMAVYALALVVGGQVAWYHALRSLKPIVVANWSVLMPILAILFAFLLLDERPTTAQLVGGGVVIVGMLISRLGRHPAAIETRTMERSLAAG